LITLTAGILKIVEKRQKVDEVALADVDRHLNDVVDAVEGTGHHRRRGLRRLRTHRRSEDVTGRRRHLQVRRQSVEVVLPRRRRRRVGRRFADAANATDG
jgi:hypothetical protein